MHIRVDLMKHECPCSIRKMNYYKTLLLPVQRVREKNLEKVFLNRGDGNVCTCDTELTEQTATIDHIKPKFKGGHSTRSNMGACCSKCNSKKGSQLVFDYFNESHPCYSKAKASKIKEWTDQHFVLLSLTPE